MTDVTIQWQVDEGDWVLAGADLETGNDLATAVLISAFTDQVAASDDVIPDAPQGQPGDPRGWWGDEGETYPIGSRLWLVLGRAKQTAQVLTAAKAALVDCLAWMIADGVVASIAVSCWYSARGMFAGKVELYRQSGPMVAVNFQTAVGS